MRIRSVHRSAGTPNPARPGRTTGIDKRPVDTAEITADGLTGDTIADRVHHGGPDQAVYLYGQPDRDRWAAELGREVPAGAFGENLVVDGLVSADVAVGDHFHIGDRIVLEATAPREPCGTLERHMAYLGFAAGFSSRFRTARRPGVYCRVIEGGILCPGDPVRIEPAREPRITIGEVFDTLFDRDADEATLRRCLTAPLAERVRIGFKRRLTDR